MKRGQEDDGPAPSKRPRDDESDEEEEAGPAQPAMTAAEREQAERLHRTALRAEALSSAQTAAKERGVALSAEETAALKAKEDAKPTFLTKAQREQAALERLASKREAKASDAKKGSKGRFSAPPPPRDYGGAADAARLPRVPQYEPAPVSDKKKPRKDIHSTLKPKKEEEKPKDARGDALHEKELRLIRENYLGKGPRVKKVVKPSEKFARIFQFDWDAKDDTSTDLNPLYARRHAIQPMLGRGYLAGTDMREQRRGLNFSQVLADKRMDEDRKADDAEGIARAERKRREAERKKEREEIRKKMEAETAKVEATYIGKKQGHWSEKPLAEMTDRDWRIMKEDFDIRIRGGNAPMPLRHWVEAPLGEGLQRAIVEAKYVQPSPIQRMAIPIGLELRDLIGIAETGSGKTAAFALPMLRYIEGLPKARIASLADDGPLAVILAPTRELAQQICNEVNKLASYLECKAITVVGGKSIEDQAFLLREGVEIIVGTPGRVNDCLDTQYMVLNQANYVVLDEADRMIDMGFEPQVHEILEQMGGLLLSENEVEVAEQREAIKRGEACFRITHMFSATMPPGVEKLAKKFLRHPAIVCIGDEDSGKNKRIQQKVMYMGEPAKKTAIIDLLRKRGRDEKYIIFCNEKKGCDALYKLVQNGGFRAGVLHGGKTQQMRDLTLQDFKDNKLFILIATDVAGRGLDIPNIAHVINYDMPMKIDNYCHRIGRTGRAGREGLATTLLTDEDEGIFYELHEYLEQTNSAIPDKLAKHPAAHAKPGERNERGELLTMRASMRGTQYLKEDKFASG